MIAIAEEKLTKSELAALFRAAAQPQD